jgi:hypothetical protein
MRKRLGLVITGSLVFLLLLSIIAYRSFAFSKIALFDRLLRKIDLTMQRLYYDNTLGFKPIYQKVAPDFPEWRPARIEYTSNNTVFDGTDYISAYAVVKDWNFDKKELLVKLYSGDSITIVFDLNQRTPRTFINAFSIDPNSAVPHLDAYDYVQTSGGDYQQLFMKDDILAIVFEPDAKDNIFQGAKISPRLILIESRGR